MAESTFEFELGEYDGRVYLFSARSQPDFDTPEEFAVTLYYNDSETASNVEIARIDTAHSHTHLDKLYHRDEPKEPLDDDFWDAIERLEDNWRTYAASYERTH
jgi:hypothetical protein